MLDTATGDGCRGNSLRCANGKCLPVTGKSQLCDGVDYCGDGSTAKSIGCGKQARVYIDYTGHVNKQDAGYAADVLLAIGIALTSWWSMVKAAFDQPGKIWNGEHFCQ